ncbi:WD40 repeat domain-containing protein [Iningainema sp. BLCCT55]|uniref:WD40 repeat domain-containing protein n=3 Tax=Iningainema TaxID=1932705 RepID=A0A8J6XQ63_9CYAN|nr:WD40 repeat domain-containing protein [Iningainema tapete]MBD2777477.1 WD40 repeat domain-containing protein [Iningainema tapete BLCC-T55]
MKFVKSIFMLVSLAGAMAIAPVNQVSNAAPRIIEITPSVQANRNFTNPQLAYTLLEHTGTIKSLAISPNGRVLFSGGAENEGIIRLWDLQTGKKVGTINRAQKTAVESMVISPNGLNLASCSNDNTINLWNLTNNKFTRSFVDHTSNVLSLAVTPDSKVLVSGALDGIKLWDLLQQRPLGTLVRFDNPVNTLAISPDGQTLVSGDNQGVIKLWSLNTGRLIRTIKAHSNRVSQIAFTPNGQVFVSASRDRTIKLWNLNSGTLVRTLTGHNNWVNTITINPNGQTLASGGRDGIKLWNLTTGELTRTLYGHSDWVSVLAFSPTGQTLVSGGFDKRINIWQSL